MCSDTFDTYDQHYGRGLLKDSIRDGTYGSCAEAWGQGTTIYSIISKSDLICVSCVYE